MYVQTEWKTEGEVDGGGFGSKPGNVDVWTSVGPHLTTRTLFMLEVKW